MEHQKPSSITTKLATRATGKHGKSLEPPAHHAAVQRRTVAVDEEKKERDAREASMRKHHPHAGHDNAEQH